MRKRHALPFPILHEDDDVIVIAKPAGLLSTHTHVIGRAAREAQLTAENLLNDYVRKGQAKSRRRVWLVHRLDRETSGVMMFAKSEEVAEAFRSDWNNLTEKKYLARVEGELEEDSGVFESYLAEDKDGYKVRSVRVDLGSVRVGVGSGSHDGDLTLRDSKQTLKDPKQTLRDSKIKSGKFARTEWRRLSVEDGTTLVEVSLKSGRKNQIRVHFSEAGHPVIGDEKYGGERASRLYLHALSLRFRHPRTGEWLEFTAPPPAGLEENGSRTAARKVKPATKP